MQRNGLMDLFDKLTEKKLIYIHAPAGYGKSYSARMWLEKTGRQSAWISMSESAGQKPAEFCERLLSALGALQPENSDLKEITAQKSFASAPFAYMDKAVKAFCSVLAGGSYTLVIDDLHLVTDKSILKVLPELISRLTERITVLLLSRNDPPDNFSELVLKENLAMVNADSLKFSRGEIRELFTDHGQQISIKQSEEVLAATGGWAIGLNAIMLSGGHPTEKSC